jgi:serine/threonine protein kinase
MIKWTTNLPKDKKMRIQSFIENLESEIEQMSYDFPEPIGNGQFADCYEIDGLIVKRTHYDVLDDNWNENLQVELNFTLDHYIMEDLQHLNCIPVLYGFSEGYSDSYTIMEKVPGEDLETFLLKGEQLTKEREEAIVEGLESVLEGGYYPCDLGMEDIYLKDEKVTFIDFNVFQEMDYLRLENANLDFSKTNRELAEAFWFDLKFWGLKWVNQQKMLA